jgi:cytochrome c peroxidase
LHPYVKAFNTVFGKRGEEITMEEVKMAIAGFERTIIAGDSPFDRYMYGGDKTAMTAFTSRADEFTAADLARWQAEYLAVVKEDGQQGGEISFPNLPCAHPQTPQQLSETSPPGG